MPSITFDRVKTTLARRPQFSVEGFALLTSLHVTAWSLPIGMKMRGGLLKVLPRELLGRYLPQELIVRNKSGFGAPVGDGLRGPVREWAQAQLNERRLREEGHFDPEPVRAVWRDFQAGRRKLHSHLWPILMFQAWREKLYG